MPPRSTSLIQVQKDEEEVEEEEKDKSNSTEKRIRSRAEKLTTHQKKKICQVYFPRGKKSKGHAR